MVCWYFLISNNTNVPGRYKVFLFLVGTYTPHLLHVPGTVGLEGSYFRFVTPFCLCSPACPLPARFLGYLVATCPLCGVVLKWAPNFTPSDEGSPATYIICSVMVMEDMPEELFFPFPFPWYGCFEGHLSYCDLLAGFRPAAIVSIDASGSQLSSLSSSSSLPHFSPRGRGFTSSSVSISSQYRNSWGTT